MCLHMTSLWEIKKKKKKEKHCQWKWSSSFQKLIWWNFKTQQDIKLFFYSKQTRIWSVLSAMKVVNQYFCSFALSTHIPVSHGYWVVHLFAPPCILLHSLLCLGSYTKSLKGSQALQLLGWVQPLGCPGWVEREEKREMECLSPSQRPGCSWVHS